MTVRVPVAVPAAGTPDDRRAARLIDAAIERFELDLRGYTVFTEAASGAFRWTPIIALRGGADRVYAITRDSRYGTAASVEAQTRELAHRIGAADRLYVTLDDHAIADADIVTNLGFVRPLDRSRIARLKPTAVVPLMWEAWEYRAADLDLRACYERDILVLGTNEHHPDLQIFGYVGMLAVKLLLEAGIELFRSRVLIVGGGTFGHESAAAITRLGASVGVVCNDPRGIGPHEDRWLGKSLAEPAAREFIREADALLFVEHESDALLVGAGGALTAEELASLNPTVRIAHVSGRIGADDVRAHGLAVVPEIVAGASRTMSVTTAHVGVRPIIDLHAAGLRVGQIMADARAGTGSVPEARERALRHSLCDPFTSAQLAALGIT